MSSDAIGDTALAMRCYSVVEIEVTDPSWVQEYLEKVTPMVERHGGRYLARALEVERIEGDGALPQSFAIMEWPSREAIDAFYESEEYRPYREKRIKGARNEIFLVTGEDFAGVAHID
jgi:uncharacterized protein (DUF1330 family)